MMAMFSGGVYVCHGCKYRREHQSLRGKMSELTDGRCWIVSSGTQTRSCWTEKPKFHQNGPDLPFHSSSPIHSCYRRDPYRHFSPPLTMTFQDPVWSNNWPRVQVQEWGAPHSAQATMIIPAMSAMSPAVALVSEEPCFFVERGISSGIRKGTATIPR